ncbi:MAG TPA: DALR anticodon-binding domain-containing protein [Candidatus Binatia bacterium]|nr:DALR anticodon-binding domain-containing protein [Candidatus Binatia bacterium]
MKPYVDALVREALSDAIEAGLLRTRTIPGFRVDAPRYPAFGDLACDVALVLARELGEPPLAIAALVTGRLRDRHGWLAAVDVGGPGFVNFRFAPSFWRARLADAVAAGTGYGQVVSGRGRRVRIEMEPGDRSAAPSVEDGRGAAVAGAAARLLAAAGSDVEQIGGVPDLDPPATAAVATGTPDEIVAVVGAAQAACVVRRAAARSEAALRVLTVHPVRLTRDGEPVRSALTLREVVDEVGGDATRFLLLLERPERPVDLDLELAKLERTDNPLFYVQYACARLARVAGATVPGAGESDLSHLDAELDDSDVEPLRMLAAWPDVVDQATRAVEPHRIAAHAVELAAVAHRWMNRNRMVTKEPEPTRARLALARCLRQMLNEALRLCGVSAPERIARPDVEEVERWRTR